MPWIFHKRSSRQLSSPRYEVYEISGLESAVGARPVDAEKDVGSYDCLDAGGRTMQEQLSRIEFGTKAE